MWKLLIGNPWVTIGLIIALLLVGAAGGRYVTVLQKDHEIAEIQAAEARLQATLAQNLIEAQQQARSTEQALNDRQAEEQMLWQKRQAQLEIRHGKDAEALAKLRSNGGGSILSRDAVLAWLHDNPESTNDDKHVPAPTGDTSGAANGRLACTESDLLSDRNNWKSSYDTCHNQLTLCKSTLKEWHDKINGDKK